MGGTDETDLVPFRAGTPAEGREWQLSSDPDLVPVLAGGLDDPV